MADDNATLQNDLMDMINDRQQISYEELSEMAMSRGIPENKLKGTLTDLERNKAIASRSSGGILTYYILQGPEQIRRILIVEDDKNINKLMSLSIGKGFDIGQIYDGGEAISAIRTKKPDLVILDLMLPHKDGLDICQTIKSDPDISGIIVILVSAMDPTSNRFKGIKYGADYYIKKPFDPSELKNLVTLFLMKKGKRFDALVDLPDEERISAQIESSIKQGESYEIGTLRIDNLGTYARKFGERAAVVLLRLTSQLLQDELKPANAFVGFLNSDQFVVAGTKDNVDSMVKKVREEFTAVLPFVLQDAGFKLLDVDMESLFESEEVPKLSLVFTESDKKILEERRNEVLKSKGKAEGNANEIGSYTYEELQEIFGKKDLEVKITRDQSGVRVSVGKNAEDKKD